MDLNLSNYLVFLKSENNDRCKIEFFKIALLLQKLYAIVVSSYSGSSLFIVWLNAQPFDIKLN